MSTMIAVSVFILKAWIAFYLVMGLLLGVVMIFKRIKKSKATGYEKLSNHTHTSESPH